MVYPYYKDYEPVTVQIVNGKTTYQHMYGRNYISVIHNGLHMPSKYPYLICPNKLRLNVVAMYDLPQNLSPNGEYPHSINVPINDLELFGLPLNIDGVISNFPIIFPTECGVEECTKLA